jgi:hypothetical protein
MSLAFKPGDPLPWASAQGIPLGPLGHCATKGTWLVQDRDCLLIDGTGLFQQLLETITVLKKEMESRRSEKKLEQIKKKKKAIVGG